MSADEGRGAKLLLMAAAVVSALAWGPTWLEPILLNEIRLRFPAITASGIVLGIELAAISLSCFVSRHLSYHLSLRKVASIGAGLAVLGGVLGILTTSYMVLVAARALSGAGEGALLMVSIAVPGLMASPERAFAKVNLWTIIFGMGIVYVAPIIVSHSGLKDSYLALVVLTLISIPAIALIPGERTKNEDSQHNDTMEVEHYADVRIKILLPAAVFICLAFSTCVWAYCFVFGQAIGGSELGLNRAIMVSIGLSTISCLFVGSKFDRFGTLLPLSVSLLLIAISTVVMCMTRELAVFYLAVALFLPGLYLLLPYVLGLASQSDASGRAANTIGVIALISQAIGPTLGGFLFSHGGPLVMGTIVGLVDASVLALLSWIVLTAPPSSEHRR